MVRSAPFAALALALSLAGCDKAGYRYTDDVKVQFAEDEKVASIKEQLGCEGAHPAKESDGDKKDREKRAPTSDIGKAWVTEACRIADAFDTAGPVTTWPDDKAVWAGERICRTEISRVAEKIDDTSFARMGRVEIQKGAGEKLWPTGPDIDQKDKILPYNFLITDVSFRVTKEKLDDIDAFFKALANGEHVDVETLRKDENKSDRETTDAADKIVSAHTKRGILVKSDGASTLAYPVLGEKGDSSAVHYLRQAGDKLLIASPMLGASQPSACVAELTLQK